MSVIVTIKGMPFTIPQRKERGWGDQVTNWIISASRAIDDLTVAGDIKLISVSVNNNQATPTNVPNLRFDTLQTRHAIVDYGVYRIKGSEELSEMASLYVTYKSSAGTWELIDNGVGISGLSFSITGAGQVQYTSSNMVDVGVYTGKMSFRARSFPV